MSAYLVPHGTITAIVRTGLRYGMGSLSSASLTGQALLWENVASVTYLYRRDLWSNSHLPGQLTTEPLVVHTLRSDDGTALAYLNPSPYVYPRRGDDEPALDPGKVLSAIASYRYQSCEHPGWAASASQRFINELKRRIERRGHVETEVNGGPTTWASELEGYYVDSCSDEDEAQRLIDSAFSEGE